MTWVLIALVLVVAFGPVLWLVPSKRDKRLSVMRTKARTEGLIVEMRRIPKPNPAPEDRVSAGGKVREAVIECASYGLPISRKLKYLPTWRLLRKVAENGDDPLPDWQYDRRPKGEGRSHLQAMLEITREALPRLPPDVAALEVGPRMLLAFWLERPGTNEESVVELAAVLRALEGSFSGLEAELEADRTCNDS